MYFSDSFFLSMIMINFWLLCCSAPRLLNFIIFSEMFLMNFIYFFSISSLYFELACGSILFVLGAGETSVGFFLLVLVLRTNSMEIFRFSNLLLCEGF